MSTAVMPSPTTKGKVKKPVFDLDKMEKVSVEVEYDIPQPIDEQGLAKVSTSDLLRAYNTFQTKLARQAAKNSIQGANPGVVNSFLRGFYGLPMFWIGADGKRLTDVNGKPLTKLTDETEKLIDKNQRKNAIWAMIKSNEAMLESLKIAAANSQDEEDEDDDTEA